MSPRRFRVIDLMVVVLVVAIFLGIGTRWEISTRCICTRRAQCSNNMRQLGLALLNFQMAKNAFPNAGTFRDDPAIHEGDPKRSSIYESIIDPGARGHGPEAWLHNWVVEIMPYLDQPDIAEAWDPTAPYWWPTPTISGQPANAVVSTTVLGILRCPEDPNTRVGEANLSYVINGGFSRWYPIPVGWEGSRIDGQSGNGGVRQWAPAGSPWPESLKVGRKLGVMFLGTHTGDQPWDVKTTPADITDGASNTLMIAENTLAGTSNGNRYSGGVATNWACPLANFAMFVGSDDVCRTDRSADDCLGGQLALRPGGADGPGWTRANRPKTYENVNYGVNLGVKGSFPFASSRHQPKGANFVFCDGATRFISETIDGTVYSKIITPGGSRLPEALRQGPLPSGVDFDR